MNTTLFVSIATTAIGISFLCAEVDGIIEVELEVEFGVFAAAVEAVEVEVVREADSMSIGAPMIFLFVGSPLNKFGFLNIALQAAIMDQKGCTTMVFSIMVIFGDTVVVVKDLDVAEDVEEVVVVVVVVAAVALVVVAAAAAAVAAVAAVVVAVVKGVYLGAIIGFVVDEALILFFSFVSLQLKGETIKFSKFLNAIEFQFRLTVRFFTSSPCLILTSMSNNFFRSTLTVISSLLPTLGIEFCIIVDLLEKNALLMMWMDKNKYIWIL